MKKTMCLLAVIALIIASATGCGGIKYCEVDGCPNEAFSYSDYCTRYGCYNYSCSNRATSNGYCEECLEAAND